MGERAQRSAAPREAMMQGRAWLVAVALGLAGGTAACSHPPASVDAHQLVAQGAALVDVRSPAEFAAGHIEGAINIPVEELPGRLAEVGPHEKPVVLYCRSGRRSANAAALLRQAGFQSVHDIGAMSNW